MRIFKFVLINFLVAVNSFNTGLLYLGHNKNIPIKSSLIQQYYNFNYQYKMTDNHFKNYNEKVNFLPSFQTEVIINNWINYINEQDEQNDIPKFIKKSILDLKFFISINRNQNNKVLISWCPNRDNDNYISYLIAGKLINKIIYIERIAQNPIFVDLNLRSQDFVIDLEKSVINKDNIVGFNYENLHQYDNRYYLSWNI
tara:strand:- start:83 stop:679 length:597 start_codon:yes stop_codon:yes gene_type:complete